MIEVTTSVRPLARGASALTLCRLRRGLTQAELAARAGVARETVSRCERGGTPQLRTARLIADALELELKLVFPGSST